MANKYDLTAGPTTLWDIDHTEAKARIEARRKRISNRLEAAKKLTTMIKIGQMFTGVPSEVLQMEEQGNFVAVVKLNYMI